MKRIEEGLLYNGTFEGLMGTVYHCLSHKIIPYDIKPSNNYEINLFTNYLTLKNNEIKSSKLIEMITKKVSPLALYIVCNVYLSNDPKKEMIILYFLLNGFKYGEKIVNLRNLNCVSKALKISRYVRREAHRLKGFLRFEELNNGILYAEMAPENNILLLVSKHFKNRLKNEYFIIRDEKRHLISFYDKKNITIIDDRDFDNDKLVKGKKEDEIISMWKCFIKKVAISERKNLRCQMNFMPKKYWKYMVEVKDDLNG